ncbi:unnamed protein product, partial [Staurois parvus]
TVFNLPSGIPECSSGENFSSKSGNPELHLGIPCSVSPGSLLHLPCPSLSRCPPAASPAISSGRCRHLSSGFLYLRASEHTGRAGHRTGGKLKTFTSDIH